MHCQPKPIGWALLGSLLPLFSIAQTSINGVLQDESDQPLGYAGVMLLTPADSTLIKGEVTADDGTFSFKDVDPGTYVFSASMIGYEDLYTEAFSVTAGASQSLGTISMQPDALTLDAVEVKARKPLFEQRIDRLVVNVAESITSAGSTALEVLERSPGVIVNRQNNDISMAGKSGVIIMINNKINRLPMDALIQMLEGMPADNIEKIELITTPPANFDAEGNAGIINIILKKNQDEGVNGSVSLVAGYGFNEKYGGNGNFNFRKGRVNVFGDYGYFNNHSFQVFENYRAFTFNGDLIENDIVSDRDPYTRTQNARLGLDLQLSDKTVIGILGSWGERKWTMDAVNTVSLLENKALQEQIIITNDELNLWSNYLGNFNLQHQFDEGSRLTFDLDYAYYVNDNPTNYLNEFFNSDGEPTDATELRVDKDTPITIGVGKLDFTKAFSDQVTLEAGAKGTLSSFDNDFSVENLIANDWVIDDRYTANYHLDENIGALYTSLSWQLTKNTGVKAGLRYEYTTSNLGSETQPDIVDRKYGNFFPSVFLTQGMGEGQELQLSYSRRINRPAYTQLAPFVIFLDPNTLLSGNEALQPALTDAFRSSYRWNSWFFALEYGYTDNAIAGVQPSVDPETNQQVNGPINQDFQRNFSASISFPIQVTDWWSMRNNLVVFWIENQVTVEGVQQSNDLGTFRANTTQSFTLPWQSSLEVTGFYMSSVAWGLLTSRARYDVNLGLQKSFADGRSSLRINLNNIFIGGNWIAEIDAPELNLDYRGVYRFQERQVRVTYSYNFGRNQVKGARRRTTGSSEEQQRIQQ